jgi:hypothetical protein
MPKWVEMLNEHLPHGKPTVRIIGFFGHTGNFLADSPSTDLREVAARFTGLVDTDWVVRSIGDVQAALTALADAPRPGAEKGIRWTPGVAFHGLDGIQYGQLSTTSRAVLWKICPHTVGVWKRDTLGAGETLDKDRRGGGWGHVSDDVEERLGGRWTARSRRTIDGLVRKAANAERRVASNLV